MDDQLRDILADEITRQTEGIELIPSENYVSGDVLAAMGTIFNNKYSEGYPGARYYAGQQNTDKIENIAIARAKQLFRADHANVQPHAGAQANAAVYHAWCDPGDTILAMDLSHGGHLTHGAPVTILAKEFNFVRYGMKDVSTGELDYDNIAELIKQHKPKIVVAGFSAYPRNIDYAKFVQAAGDSGALLMADMAHIAGLIAGGVADNPLDAGFHVITSTTHKTLRGPRGGLILSNGIVGNPLKIPKKTLANIPTLIDRAVFPGLQGGPHMNMIFAKAVAFGEAMQPSFHQYSKLILANAKELANQLNSRGFKLVTGGTSNHLILIDMVASRSVDGKVAEDALEAIGLTCNKNSIPDDKNSMFRPSGLRIGTPAITTRGFKPQHMAQIADWFEAALDAADNPAAQAELKQKVAAFCRNFPLPN